MHATRYVNSLRQRTVRKLRKKVVAKRKGAFVKKARLLSSTVKKARTSLSKVASTREITLKSYGDAIKDLKKYRIAGIALAKKIGKKLEAIESKALKLEKVSENRPWAYSNFSPSAASLLSELVEGIETTFDAVIDQVQDGLNDTKNDRPT